MPETGWTMVSIEDMLDDVKTSACLFVNITFRMLPKA